ncbi:immunoglobulin J chain-like [Hemiscyllium ocellatum]|uniref:immunoglobulin J chain-like n=1 Tax=Hemiscyllium ocellatum TaxID=170820 RepID=UPI002966772D|nr:immunoglobulin J chain-like [Hemiscyllium ocellatum]
MMNNKDMLRILTAILFYTALSAANSETNLLVSSKCKLLEVSSKMIITEQPNGEKVEQLARDIKIIVPLRTRQNISDPTSPLRTHFVYKISDFCKNCGQKQQSPEQPQCKPKPPPTDECYAHDDKSCSDYRRHFGPVQHFKERWTQKPTEMPLHATIDPNSFSDAP